VTICRHCSAYGNNLAQCFVRIRIKKNAVVQMVESAFINKLFLKLAASSFCHTFVIQNKKNNTTGSITSKYQKK
jgi:hypothetical protein